MTGLPIPLHNTRLSKILTDDEQLRKTFGKIFNILQDILWIISFEKFHWHKLLWMTYFEKFCRQIYFSRED